MGRIGATIPGFCLNRIRPQVRIRSPIAQSAKNHSESAVSEEEKKGDDGNAEKEKRSIEVVNVKPAVINVGRKIMVVVDSSPEAKNAIHWALTHTVRSHDVLILLYVTKPSNSGSTISPIICLNVEF